MCRQVRKGKFTIKNWRVFKKGFYQERSSGQQLLLLMSLTLMSFFSIGLLGTFLLSAITGITVEQLATLSKMKVPHPQLGFFIRGMQLAQFLGLFLVPSWLATRLFSAEPARSYLKLNRPVHSGFWIIGVTVLLFALPLVQWLGELNRVVEFPSALAEWMKAQENEANDTVKALLGLRSTSDLLLNILFIAGLAAVGEELLFRGVLQKMFFRQFGQAWPAILLSAFLFSSMHMQFYGFLPRFVLGILLGAVYWYSGSLWAAILSHFFYDALLIVLVYFNPVLLNEEPVVGPQTLMISGLVSALLVTMHFHWMMRHSDTDQDHDISDESSAHPS
ncbi:MAG: CPBP family intramembrane metalloprotease [Sphingomonadales bacterium]|nr:CPBP family intramembrane metalloprotease [Sphingomonadales bacterium]